MTTRLKLSCFFTITFLLTISLNVTFAIGFEKSIAIDQTFTVSQLSNSDHISLLDKHTQSITDLTSNVLRSFQQDFDYQFFANYQSSTKEIGTFICSGKLLDKTAMNRRSKIYQYNDGEFFLRIELYDPSTNTTIFGKSFIIDSYIKKGDNLNLMQQLQNELKLPLGMYFFNTSRSMPAHNSRLDSITLSIDQVFKSNSDQVDETYLTKLADLTSNAIIMHQKSKSNQHIEGEKYRFQFFRNYQKEESYHKQSHVEVKGAINFDKSKDQYTLSIDFLIDGKKVNIPVSLNPPIEFLGRDRDNYVEVALHIKQKIGLILYYYFDRYLPNTSG